MHYPWRLTNKTKDFEVDSKHKVTDKQIKTNQVKEFEL